MPQVSARGLRGPHLSGVSKASRSACSARRGWAVRRRPPCRLTTSWMCTPDSLVICHVCPDSALQPWQPHTASETRRAVCSYHWT